MKLNRKELLHRLLCVSPAIKRGNILQSDCVVLRRGRFYTLSRELACSMTSGLPKEIEGALAAEKLIDLLKALPDDEIDFEIRNQTLYLESLEDKKRRVKLPMEEKVTLPVDEVEKPKDWVNLSEEFALAVDLTHRCTKRKSDFLKECIHIHPEYLEASDNIKMLRYTLSTFVKESVLVRGEVIKEVVQLGFTKACETNNWLHFYNPIGLRLSAKKYKMEKYPALGEILKIRGRKVVFPKSLGEIITRAGILAETVQVKVSKDGLIVSSRSSEGEYTELGKVDFTGEDLTFVIPPKLLEDMVEKGPVCEIASRLLRLQNDKYVYITSLQTVGESNGRAEERAE